MSKYNVGDKFTIEIKELINGSNDKMFYKSDCYSIIFSEEQLDKLQKYGEVKERLELIDELKMVEYNKGLEDAWGLARKVGMYDGFKLKEIFGVEEFDLIEDDEDSPYSLVMKMKPQEAIAKIEAYEKEQEKARQKIMVGDIVALEGGTRGVVMDEDGVDNVVIFTENGCIEAWMNKKYITKTGKHIDIQSILQQIGE